MPYRSVDKDNVYFSGPLAEWMQLINSWYQQDAVFAGFLMLHFLGLVAFAFGNRAIQKWKTSILQKHNAKVIMDLEKSQPDGVYLDPLNTLDYLADHLNRNDFNNWQMECRMEMQNVLKSRGGYKNPEERLPSSIICQYLYKWYQEDAAAWGFPLDLYLALGTSVFREHAKQKWGSDSSTQWRNREILQFEKKLPAGKVLCQIGPMLDYIGENIPPGELASWAPNCHSETREKLNNLGGK